jgi:phosphoribosyl 1,2-cyclic phosphodiesterase
MQGFFMLQICALASGSKGNALYVSDGSTSILLDAGFSGKELENRLSVHGINPGNIDAVIVSHEHSDHIRGVGILARRYNLTAIISKPTYSCCAAALGRIENLKHFSAGKKFSVGSLSIHPFPTSHDAADPVGFTIESGGIKIGIATDLGVPTAAVAHHLSGCCALVVEANHDIKMLEDGPYPWHLKQRVKSRLGHLSNEACRDLVAGLVHKGLTHVVLGHLSETNNRPEIALNAVAPALNGHGAKLLAAHQSLCGDMLKIRL